MALEFPRNLVPKQPRLGSHRLVVAAVDLLQGHIGGGILPCRYETSLVLETQPSLTNMRRLREERPLLVPVKQWVEWGWKSL